MLVEALGIFLVHVQYVVHKPMGDEGEMVLVKVTAFIECLDKMRSLVQEAVMRLLMDGCLFKTELLEILLFSLEMHHSMFSKLMEYRTCFLTVLCIGNQLVEDLNLLLVLIIDLFNTDR